MSHDFDTGSKECAAAGIDLATRLAASAWQTPNTQHIEMDVRLAEAFVVILREVLSQPWLGNATNGQLLDELKARVNLEYSTVKGEELSTQLPSTASPAKSIAEQDALIPRCRQCQTCQGSAMNHHWSLYCPEPDDESGEDHPLVLQCRHCPAEIQSFDPDDPNCPDH
jgi:hypothetical protein